MFFKSLSLDNWRQFGAVRIEFHNRLTVLTGPNGTGKTTIIDALAGRMDWQRPLIATPLAQFDIDGTQMWSSDARGSETEEESAEGEVLIGDIQFTGEFVSEPFKQAKRLKSAEYQPFSGGLHTGGVFIPSPRAAFIYEPLSKIQIPASGAKTYKQQLAFLYKLQYQGNSGAYSFSYRRQPTQHRTDGLGGERPANGILKESLISCALYGYGGHPVMPMPELRQIFEDFGHILKRLLPENLQFEELVVRTSEIVLRLKVGEFSLDAVSCGLASIIDIAWQIYLQSDDQDLVVLIDEPELHLHPGMQQRILPDLLSAFEKAQFIVTTHSPLVATSVKDSAIYMLNLDHESGRVNSSLWELNRAQTADGALEKLLGLDYTLPIWAGKKLHSIVMKYAKEKPSPELFEMMKRELQENNLGDFSLDVTSGLLEHAPPEDGSPEPFWTKRK
jgi:predicted ATPase